MLDNSLPIPYGVTFSVSEVEDGESPHFFVTSSSLWDGCQDKLTLEDLESIFLSSPCLDYSVFDCR